MSADADNECEQHILKLEDDVTMAFRRIPACPQGFLMGSRGYSANEEPMHRVVIPENFWLAETPVTQAQFAVWTRSAGIAHTNANEGKSDHPAEQMSWHEAGQCCDWLTKHFANELPPECRFAKLPTEAHWEYACRGGTETEYHTGDGQAALREAGWFDKNANDTTHPVAQLQPNRWDLYDMHGNVWEWCLDRWDEQAYRRRWNGITAAETAALNEQFGARELYGNPDPRVLRGGSCVFAADWCRSACRFRGSAGYRSRNYGFRVCLVRSPLHSQTAVAEQERTALERRDGANGGRE